MCRLTEEEALNAVLTLRDRGYAVTVFAPDELEGADPSTVEYLMMERGWNAIDTLKEEEEA